MKAALNGVGRFPHAGMPAWNGLPFGAGNGLLELLGQAHGNEDVFLAGQHQRRHLDLAEPSAASCVWITASWAR